MTEGQKKSLIAGGLISTAGIFLTKMLGVLYVSPFTALATSENLSYYARAYSFYDIVVRLSVSGLPFAIATLVTRYVLKEEFKTVLYIRKLAFALMAVIGFVAMVSMFLLATPLAMFSVQSGLQSTEVIYTRNVIMIIALAIFVVPLLSSYRGYLQGLKEFRVYATSQVLEQIARVSFLLGLGFLLVVILNMNAIWAVYAAIMATSVSALCSLAYLIFKDRKTNGNIRQLALTQTVPVPRRKELLLELMYFALPFMLNAILSNTDQLINLMLFNRAMLMAGSTVKEANLYYSLILLTTNKLTSIPQVIAPGFAIAIIPFVTEAFEKRDKAKLQEHVLSAFNTVLYVALPLTLFLFAISDKVYYVMYGGDVLAQGASVLTINSILGVEVAMVMVIDAMMLALRLRRLNLSLTAVAFVVRLLIFIPLVILLGFAGSIVSGILTQSIYILVCLYVLKRQYDVNYYSLYKTLIQSAIGLAAMALCFKGLELIGLMVIDQNRWFALLELTIYGIVGMAVYMGITEYMHVPKRLFHISYIQLIKKAFHAIG